MSGDINTLIGDITPLYNQYKQDKNITGKEALKIMWEIGEILQIYIKKNDIAPHNLYRQVYGLSEGTSNTSRKSWITREFQGRCFRIRNFFKYEDIDSLFPTLKSFTLFRESMPFLCNEKYLLKGQEREELLENLNSNKSNKEILKYINNLQNKKIDKKNPRTQRLNDLDKPKEIFIEFYKYIHESLQDEIDKLKQNLHDKNISNEFLKNTAYNLNALTADNLRFKEYEIPSKIDDDLWKNFNECIQSFVGDKDKKRIRRFRRVIPIERMVMLADMLNEIADKNKP